MPFSTGKGFSTGRGFAHVPTCLAEVTAPAGATQIRVRAAQAPKIGQIMSHETWPFMVTAVTPTSDDVYDLDVQMPLRSPIPAQARINLQAIGLFEAVEEAMGNPAYGTSHVSRIRLSFREVLNR